MWKIVENEQKLVLISIPMSLIFLLLGGILLQGFVICLFYQTFIEGNFSSILGFNLPSKALNLVTYFFPILFSLLSVFLIPIIKTEIDKNKQTISVKKLPFGKNRRFGSDFIKDKIKVNLERNTENQGLYFELNSGEIVKICSDNSTTEHQTKEIAEKINRFIKF
jgi:hypothetical protein